MARKLQLRWSVSRHKPVPISGNQERRVERLLARARWLLLEKSFFSHALRPRARQLSLSSRSKFASVLDTNVTQ